MMTAADLSILVILALAVAVVPPILLRRDHKKWAIAEALFWAASALSWAAGRALEIEIDGTLLFAIAFVARTILFVGLVLATDESTLAWSPRRAAIAAGFLYLLLVPHVLRWPIDGDEPYYVLIAESIIADHDLDLANQYRNPAKSVTGRSDLGPQLGDPFGEGGEIYSRHEPFFPLLLIPGLLLGGLHGAAATVAILGALLVGSVLKLAEENGFERASRTIVWPAIALGPPVLFYSLRLWSEVPGALALSESIRAMRARRWGPFLVWLVVLSLLHLRFGLIAGGLLLLAIVREEPRTRVIVAGVTALILPFLVFWIATGTVFGAHQVSELMPMNPLLYLRGFAGLLVDAQGGLLFQAPLWLLALLAVVRERDRSVVGDLWLTTIPYLVLLLPRAEWHGGWSPPLRYIVVLAPILALGLAAVDRWLPRAVLLLASVWTVGLVIHGIAFPWRLFHIASGESVLGAALSKMHQADLSRLLPSLIRFNQASIAWTLLVLAGAMALVLFHQRIGARSIALLVSVGVAAVALGARYPGGVVHLEDSHVAHDGGELYPERWTVARFRFRGGWSMSSGSSVTFRMKPGPARIDYASAEGAVIEIDGRHWDLPPTDGFESTRVEILDSEVKLVIIGGSAVIDRIVHE